MTSTTEEKQAFYYNRRGVQPLKPLADRDSQNAFTRTKDMVKGYMQKDGRTTQLRREIWQYNISSLSSRSQDDQGACNFSKHRYSREQYPGYKSSSSIGSGSPDFAQVWQGARAGVMQPGLSRATSWITNPTISSRQWGWQGHLCKYKWAMLHSDTHHGCLRSQNV